MCLAKLDPWCPYNDSLSAQWKAVLVFDTAQEPRPEASADDNSVWRLWDGRAVEGHRTALDDLADVLHCATNSLTSSGEEARKEVVAIHGSVDGEGGEVYSICGVEMGWEKGVLEVLKLKWMLVVKYRELCKGTYVGHP